MTSRNYRYFKIKKRTGKTLLHPIIIGYDEQTKEPICAYLKDKDGCIYGSLVEQTGIEIDNPRPYYNVGETVLSMGFLNKPVTDWKVREYSFHTQKD